MKIKIVLLSLLFSSLIFTSYSQDVRSIEKGFAVGDAVAIGKSMGNSVFYVFYPLKKTLDKDVAITELASLFKAKKPNGFSIIHDSTQDNVRYIIGKLSCTGVSYRVHLLIDTDKNNGAITQIRIEQL